jgi:hypothetical protein
MAKTKTKSTPKKRRPVPSDEQRVNLMLWQSDGVAALCEGTGKEPLSEVSVGRTDSKRGLGFEIVMRPGAEPVASFVLDRAQVERLHAFLEFQLTRIVAD